MRTTAFSSLLWLLSGCVTEAVVLSDGPDDTGDTKVVDTDHDDTGGDACGDPAYYDIRFMGVVEDVDGHPVQGVDVRLEDRGWVIGDVLGTDVTNAQGEFSMDVVDLASVPGCWGTVLDYNVVATDGWRWAERGVNLPLYNAIAFETWVADISSFPLEIE